MDFDFPGGFLSLFTPYMVRKIAQKRFHCTSIWQNSKKNQYTALLSYFIRSGSRRISNFLQERMLIAFDFIWKVLLPDRNFSTPSRSASERRLSSFSYFTVMEIKTLAVFDLFYQYCKYSVNFLIKSLSHSLLHKNISCWRLVKEGKRFFNFLCCFPFYGFYNYTTNHMLVTCRHQNT